MSGAAFDEFFRDLHGYAPFPWQSRLASAVVADGRWPDVLDLPTGSGKTSVIDVALYALAQRPEVFPRRIVFVVDRRVVVDQAADHARQVRERMKVSTGAAAEVATLLRRVFAGMAGADPFSVAVLRGGMPRDESWAKYPDRPVVALSTVDQVGSRLLFRGYGVSRRMAPIHAGLLGNDTLLLLDEVQLSTAFAETLRAIGARWMRWRDPEAPVSLPFRWAAVRMSATPVGESSDDDRRFSIADSDLADPVLSRRLEARKLAALDVVRVAGDPDRRQGEFARACSAAAREHLNRGAKTLAVIVNRVDSARRVFAELADLREKSSDVVLLTGRMRPLDRAQVLGRASDPSSLISRLTSRANRAVDARPLIVVSTQSLEAGADFDFDALVTECASIDALRQRFGRVDRRGDLGETESTILVRHDEITEKSDDPIYGRALAATWTWLSAMVTESGSVDFGVRQFPPLPADLAERSDLCSPVVHAPVMLPAHLDAWAQTNPQPQPDPDVSLWLHGPERGTPEVQIVWRADVSSDDSQSWDADILTAQLEACPPSSLEALSVPLYAARAWLKKDLRIESFGDVEGEHEDDARRDRGEDRHALPCIRYRSKKAMVVLDPSGILPGDTIVVPSTYGGIGEGNWDPVAGAPVRDLGDWAQLVHRGRPVLRLVPAVFRDWFDEVPAADTLADAPLAGDENETASDLREKVGEWLESLSAEPAPKLAIVLKFLSRRPRLIVLPNGRITLVGPRRIDVAKRLADGSLVDEAVSEVITEDDDSSSFIGREVTLTAHLDDVREVAGTFATNLGFPREIGEDVALAAWLHDIGKADPRFQRMLMGGSEVRASLQRELLAKSNGEARDAGAREVARTRAGYPRGYRHELLSVAMLDDVAIPAHDRDLVLHLVGSHHGWCRPFAPAVDPGPSLHVELDLEGQKLHADAAHSMARLDSGVAERFFDLIERYGWWGLAWLEAVMRLADHRASEMYETRDSANRDHSVQEVLV